MTSTPAPARAGAGRVSRVAVAGLLALSGPALLASATANRPSYPDGPPPGFSGGFGEQTCDACHFANPMNDPEGRLLLTGVPERYTPGEVYELVLTLTRPGMAMGGFQLTARFEEGGAQAGGVAFPESEAGRTRVSERSAVLYAHHLRPGADTIAADTARWKILWTAPAGGGPVAFHVAANAADGDDMINGDYIYTATGRAGPGR